MPAVHPLKLVNAQLQVLRARLRSMDCNEIRDRLHDVRGLGFLDQPAIIDVTGVPIDELVGAHWTGILECFRAAGLNPIGLTGLDEVKLQAALAGRLGVSSIDAALLGLKAAVAVDPEQAAGEPARADTEPRAGGSADAARVDAARVDAARVDAARVGADAPAWLPPMIVDRQVRSGQQIYARNRDVIVLAAVSPGAEVIADGNVTCYGALRGRAIAGASGKGDAFIHALDFRPELVAVAGLYMTFESGPPTMPGGRIVQVRLDSAGERLVIDTV
jgi:septum site-determining protein MinC